MTIWKILVDWDRNNDFSDTYDDLTADVISAEWFLGMDQTYQDYADNSVLSLVLNNNQKTFSPENTDNPLYPFVQPFKPIYIQSDDGINVFTHWVGWIEEIKPGVGKYGQRTVEIIAMGAMQFLKATETRIELQEDQRTDQIIAKLIQEVVMPPSLSSAWVVGRSEVGVGTWLADVIVDSQLEEGKLTIGVAADNWVRRGGYSDAIMEAFDVYRAIGDITAAERGRFFFNREGQAVFWNRHHLLGWRDEWNGGYSVPTFNDTMTNMQYTYAGLEQCKNDVIVVCHPRTLTDSDDQKLWTLGGGAINVKAGKKRKVFVGYKAEDGTRVGGKDVRIDEIKFDDHQADVTLEPRANGAYLVLDNTGGTSEAIVTKCVIKGRKITDFDTAEARATDQNSIIDYGRRTLRINLPSIDNTEAAQDIADFELHRRKEPSGEVSALTVLSHGKNGGNHHDYQLALTIGDRIHVAETQTAHGGDYFIIGEAHRLTAGATLWETTWYLEPVPQRWGLRLGDTIYGKIGATDNHPIVY